MAPASKKRKRAARENDSLDALKIFETSLKQDMTKVSLFDLPPELRNRVYEFICIGQPMILSRTKRRQLLGSPSAMPRVNKQIRDEFLSAAMLLSDVHTSIYRWEFRHIITFLNQLSAPELHTMYQPDTARQRNMVIELTHSHRWTSRHPCLDRWLRRVGDQTKKGASIDFE